MAEPLPEPLAGPKGPLARIIALWALLGGLVLLVTVLINAASILGAALITRPVPGDFELTEMLTAIAVSCFLPYCQLTGANVTADIFTSGASPRWLARFELAAAAVATFFALLLVYRMFFGMLDRQAYQDTTAILQIPIWLAYLPFLASLALLAVAALMTLRDAFRRI
ncbi:MAG TPA: TRAP transporter small permease subunit [Paracoccaceae bacterium]|nr:TRAP transporter small permease subunit [Paracoccaceae bacterium]